MPLQSDSDPTGTSAPGIILYILSSFDVKTQPRLYHKHSLMLFYNIFRSKKNGWIHWEKCFSAQAFINSIANEPSEPVAGAANQNTG